MSDGEIGYGILVKVRTSTGPDVYTTIGKQKDVSGGGWSVDAVDTSHNQSPDQVKEKIPGMIETKPVSFEIQYKLGGEAEVLLLSIRGQKKMFRTVHPSGAYFQYEAFVSDFEPEMPTEDKSSASVEITPTGDFGDPVAATAPANTVLPAISGTLTVGETLTAFEGVWDNEPTSFSYQWKNEGADISGATSKTYVLVSGDSGDNITVAVTATNSAGSTTATSDETAPV